MALEGRPDRRGRRQLRRVQGRFVPRNRQCAEPRTQGHEHPVDRSGGRFGASFFRSSTFVKRQEIFSVSSAEENEQTSIRRVAAGRKLVGKAIVYESGRRESFSAARSVFCGSLSDFHVRFPISRSSERCGVFRIPHLSEAVVPPPIVEAGDMRAVFRFARRTGRRGNAKRVLSFGLDRSGLVPKHRNISSVNRVTERLLYDFSGLSVRWR